MTAMILFLMFASVAAAVSDRDRSKRTFNVWRPLEHLAADPSRRQGRNEAAARAHGLFLKLFDRVYGRHLWSAHRLGASIVSTSVGLVVIVIAVGPDETVLGDAIQTLWSLRSVPDDPPGGLGIRFTTSSIFSILGPTIVVFVLTPVNYVADFVSLAETRFVLRCGEGRGLGAIVALVVVDLVLTGMIFLLLVTGADYFLAEEEGARSFLGVVTTVEIGLPFFLTTFVTSFGWVLFACCAIAIYLMSLCPFTRRVLEQMDRSERPTVAHVSVASVVFAGLWWPVSLAGASMLPMPLEQGADGAPVEIEVGRTYRAYFRDTAGFQASFRGERNVNYAIETVPVFAADTLLRLFRGEILVGRNDDGGIERGSLIRYPNETNSHYVVEIVPSRFSSEFTGPAYAFHFSVREVDLAGRSREEWLGHGSLLVEGSDAYARERLAEQGPLPAVLGELARDEVAGVRAVVAEQGIAPIEALERMADDSTTQVREGVGRNRSTPVVVLRRLGEDADARVREAVGENLRTPADVLRRLGGDREAGVREAVAGNSRVPTETLSVLADDVNSVVRRRVARNGSASAETLQKLAEDVGSGVRGDVAGNDSTPSQVLERLGRDTDTRVRESAAGNRNTPSQVLVELAADRDANVRRNVARNLSAPVTALRRLVRDTDASVRGGVSGNRSAPGEILVSLADDMDAGVRSDVARHPNTPPAILMRLAGDPDEAVRAMVARNENTATSVLEELVDDASSWVRLNAARRMR